MRAQLSNNKVECICRLHFAARIICLTRRHLFACFEPVGPQSFDTREKKKIGSQRPFDLSSFKSPLRFPPFANYIRFSPIPSPFMLTKPLSSNLHFSPARAPSASSPFPRFYHSTCSNGPTLHFARIPFLHLPPSWPISHVYPFELQIRSPIQQTLATALICDIPIPPNINAL